MNEIDLNHYILHKYRIESVLCCVDTNFERLIVAALIILNLLFNDACTSCNGNVMAW